MSLLSGLIGKIPVVGGAINSAFHNVIDPAARGAVSALPGGAAILGAGDAIGQHLPGEVPGAGGGTNPLATLLAGAQTLNAAHLGQKQNDYADKAWNLANDSYTSRAPLRSQGLASLLNPTKPDLSNLTAIRAKNPQSHLSGVLS